MGTAISPEPVSPNLNWIPYNIQTLTLDFSKQPIARLGDLKSTFPGSSFPWDHLQGTQQSHLLMEEDGKTVGAAHPARQEQHQNEGTAYHKLCAS